MARAKYGSFTMDYTSWTTEEILAELLKQQELESNAHVNIEILQHVLKERVAEINNKNKGTVIEA